MSKLEIIEFFRPDENSKNIFVTRIPKTVDEDEIYVRCVVYILVNYMPPCRQAEWQYEGIWLV